MGLIESYLYLSSGSHESDSLLNQATISGSKAVTDIQPFAYDNCHSIVR